ncbi:MAG TPA: YceI family protein, partial [Telluria sp.]
LDTQPDADAIAGTRTNMLTRVLEADTYPLVLLHAERNAPGSDKVRLTVTLHGVEKTLEVPVSFEPTAASGSFTLRQTDFGITPMSVLGGAIQVQDEMALRFRIVACSP